MCCATVRDVTERSVITLCTICLSLREVVPPERWMRSTTSVRRTPPASNGYISALQLFGFVQHDYRFP
ncbi:hypothetical protein TNCV_4148891 [Trichonephila clavipes]|nr:hypothetical protein TNCV_4148891 [Trichonephila clavipes]